MGTFRPEEIYEALFDEEAFARLPQVLARAGNGRSALLHWRHSAGTYETLAFDHFTPELMADYDQTFRMLDPWVHAVLDDGRHNVIINMDRALPGAYFANSIAYNECIRVHGDDTMHCLATVMETPWGQGLLGVHRGRNAPLFEDEDTKSLQDAVNVLRRVLQVRGEVIAYRRSSTTAQASLDAIGQAAIVVSKDRRVLQTNAASEAVIRRSDGFSVKDGLLGCLINGEALRLASLVAVATARASPLGGALTVSRDLDQLPYWVTVTPLVGTFTQGAALIVFRDPDAPDDTLASRLCALFALTASEATIAADLGRGISSDEIIRTRGISRNTLKFHIRAISSKMSCRRQSEIAARVAMLPAIA